MCYDDLIDTAHEYNNVTSLPLNRQSPIVILRNLALGLFSHGKAEGSRLQAFFGTLQRFSWRLKPRLKPWQGGEILRWGSISLRWAKGSRLWVPLALRL